MAILCQAYLFNRKVQRLFRKEVGLKHGESPNPKCETLLLLEDEDIV